jgi:hypothetical protein
MQDTWTKIVSVSVVAMILLICYELCICMLNKTNIRLMKLSFIVLFIRISRKVDFIFHWDRIKNKSEYGTK